MIGDSGFVGIIKLDLPETLIFGPFETYEEADIFIQQKFFEYTHAQCAYVDGLIRPWLKGATA
jgi:hypothetical protein